jgi:hypothetical protein
VITPTLFNRPCTVRYRSDGPPDEHNDPTDVWTELDTVCSIQERSRLEQGGDAQIGVTIWFVFLPPSVPIPGSADEIVHNGTTYQFHGNGGLAHDSMGRADHIELTAWTAA